jgi:dihydropteroate synthase
MQGQPQNMQNRPHYENLPGEIIEFLEQRVRCCMEAGIARNRLVVDPGFGFGKNDQHNLRILAGLREFANLQLPILVGLSRKGTLGSLTGQAEDKRVFAGVAAAVLAADRGAHIIRTHDVAATKDALRIADAVRAAGLLK